jgi:hypothetical protein
MKKDILKIAGVKSEKEFYKKYPTEEAFMAKHGGAFKKAAMGKSMVKKQLTQLTDFSNPPMAQMGAYVGGIPPEYQLQTYNTNPYSGNVSNNATYNKETGMFNSNTGQVNMADTQAAGFYDDGSKTLNRTIKDLNANQIKSGFQATSTIGKNVQKVSQAIEQKKEAKRLRAVAPVVLAASSTRPEESKRKYDRDIVGMSGGYGTGTDFLAEDGATIGGNLTEIQNMYNPGDLYSNLGYEPLDDSSKVKQYKKGGDVRRALSGAEMGMINEGINLGGDIVAGAISLGTNRLNKQSQNILQQAGFQSGMQNIQQNQYGSFMKDGGGLKYLSHDWQPQVIAKFGEYDLKDLLAPPKDADMLRAGGHLKAYTAPSEEAMSTERPMMQMGGELQTYWGGDAETISENPYLPDGGETVMFRGQSHEESDGQGRTGIGITFGQNPVEVERGEPAVKLKDGGSGEDNLIVFGNMKIPSYGVSELEDSKAKGKKFKHYAADLSKVENKANKTSDKALKLIDDVDGDNPFDLLKLNTGKAMLQGADATLKETAYKKNILAGVQSAILDTAEEMGVESDALAKGKIKPAKDSDMAKFGKKLKKAQEGKDIPKYRTYVGVADPLVDRWENLAQSVANRTQLSGPISLENKRSVPKGISEYSKQLPKGFVATPPVLNVEKGKEKSSLFEKLTDAYGDLYPYIKPGIRNPLDPGQLSGEMYALATNQLEPVQAQTYMPLLEDATSVSFQDQLNEIQAQVNAAMRLTGNNPAAQAVIASQAAAAKNKVLGEQLRINQQLGIETKRRNLEALNKAGILNLEIFDKQYQRQAAAKSATKAQAFEALSSIAEKIGKNKSETLSANVMANMYPQYSYGPQGRIYSTGTTKFNIPTIGSSTTPTDAKGDDLLPIYDKKGKVTGYKVKESRNGSIVKAIKNL